MKVYIYCTKAKPYLLKIKSEEVDFMCNYKQWLIDNDNRYQKMAYNGKIVASFDLNEIEHLKINAFEFGYVTVREDRILKKSCLTLEQLKQYAGNKNDLYAWHIENLKILDEPKELRDFNKPITESWFYRGCEKFEKAPQSWCYANYNNELCIIISIKPEWFCKILNREKTIELRKTAPKEDKS